ncbi:MAG: hypothetical protein ABWX85_13350 [Arthrobacter sp.]
MTPRPAPFRLIRAAAVATSVLSLAAGAHVLGGGQLPPVPVMGACMALVVLCTVLLTGRQLTVPALVAVLSASQVVLHEAFIVLSASGASATTPAIHVHGTSPGVTTLPAGHDLQRHLTPHMDPPMLGLHIAATLVTALLLAKAEAALWALAAWLRPLTGFRPVPILFPSPMAAIPSRRALGRRWRVLRRQPLRGPPATA